MPVPEREAVLLSEAVPLTLGELEVDRVPDTLDVPDTEPVALTLGLELSDRVPDSEFDCDCVKDVV